MPGSTIKSEVTTPDALQTGDSSNDVLSKLRSESAASKNLRKDDSSESLAKSQDRSTLKESFSDLSQYCMEAGNVLAENRLEVLNDSGKNANSQDEEGRNGELLI